MKKKISLLILFLCTLFSAAHAANDPAEKRKAGKTGTVTGIVTDSLSREAMPGAVIELDSTGMGVLTNAQGAFTLQNVPLNKATYLKVSFIGYRTLTVPFTPTEAQTALPPIEMTTEGIVLDDILVEAAPPMTIVRGDTTQYNASAFKTNPDASAGDLLSKMPGFEADENGSIKAQGEAIQRVYVDGKSYFKDDVETAMNSIPANAIESVELFDEKSEETKFTGADDGTRIKTVNIVTKAKKKNAYFGEYSAGYGTDNRYTVSALTNMFMGDHRLTFGVGSNNINISPTQNRGYYGRAGGGGISLATGVSLNYSKEFKKKESNERAGEAAFNYRFNHADNDAERASVQEYFSTENYTNRTYSSLSSSNTVTKSHNFYGMFNRTFKDKLNVFFSPNGNISLSDGDSNSESLSVINEDRTNSKTGNKSQVNSYNLNGVLSVMYKFNDKRSMTFSVNGGYSNSTNNTYLRGNITNLIDGVEKDSLYDQYSPNRAITNNIRGELRYIEKLSKRSNLMVNYSLGYNWGNADKKTYLFDERTGQYVDIDSTLSNIYNRNTLTQKAGVGYTFNNPDNGFNAMVQVNFQNDRIKQDMTYPNTMHSDYTFNSPNIMVFMGTRKKDGMNFHAHFMSSPQLPGISQLQNVINNNNPLKVSSGNPNLKQSYQNRLFLRYNLSNTLKSTSLSFDVRLTQTSNYIANRTTLLDRDTPIETASGTVIVQKGAEYTTIDNMNGYWNAGTNLSYAFPVKKIKSSLTVSLEYDYSRLPSVYNEEKLFSRNNDAGLRLALNSNISENVDFTVSNKVSYSHGNSSTGSVNNSIIERMNLRFNWIIWKGFFVNAEYMFRYNHYTQNPLQDPAQNSLNAAIGKKFMKSRMEVRLSAYDLLNQNRNISQAVRDMYVETSTSNILQRYFTLSVRYKFNTMGENSMAMEGGRGGRGGMMRPMGHPRF